jgi:NADH-quinone oxidoreductase subunit F
MSFEPVLTRNISVPNIRDVDVYRAHGGYAALKKALSLAPAEIVAQVKASGLRGRGGAGFSTAAKWGFLPRDHPGPFYMVVNFDESEPGTFKDRYLADHDPHQIIEGIVISCYAARVSRAYIYLRYEYRTQAAIMQQALAQAYQAGCLGANILGSGFSLECTLAISAGAYICGEETGMLEALEGKRAWPRVKPPFPAVEGAFAKPTVINNVETLVCVPHIINRGPEWFAGIGTPKSTGPKLYGVSGQVNKPGVYELPLGISCRDLIETHAGGVRHGKRAKAVIPGGVSMGVLTEQQLDCPLDFEGPLQYGCLGLGTAGVIVMDQDASMVRALRNIVRFFAHESCGQCTPCREGAGWMLKVLNRLLAGHAEPGDLDLLLELADQQGISDGKTICGLADGTAFATKTFIRKFRPEFEALAGSFSPQAV